MGRWWVIDPVDEFTIPYSYVGSDAINFIDSNGKESEFLYNGHKTLINDGKFDVYVTNGNMVTGEYTSTKYENVLDRDMHSNEIASVYGKNSHGNYHKYFNDFSNFIVSIPSMKRYEPQGLEDASYLFPWGTMQKGIKELSSKLLNGLYSNDVYKAAHITLTGRTRVTGKYWFKDSDDAKFFRNWQVRKVSEFFSGMTPNTLPKYNRPSLYGAYFMQVLDWFNENKSKK